MKSFLQISLVSVLLLLVFTNCKKDSLTPQEMLEGKWIITSQELLATVVPGDGSFLTFASNGTGTDYKASDQTTGSITYTLNEEATEISIADTETAGGSYNYVWDILELNETTFRITASTILGNMKIEMSKE
jgi:hypothetical protein